VDWNPPRGSEQAGMRPSLVIQNDLGNDNSSSTIVATISSKFNKIYPFQVFISAKGTGLDQDSIVDLGQFLAISKTRLIKRVGQVKIETMEQVDRALILSLGITVKAE
jgi:mRNA interferase MazF